MEPALPLRGPLNGTAFRHVPRPEDSVLSAAPAGAAVPQFGNRQDAIGLLPFWGRGLLTVLVWPAVCGWSDRGSVGYLRRRCWISSGLGPRPTGRVFPRVYLGLCVLGYRLLSAVWPAAAGLLLL